MIRQLFLMASAGLAISIPLSRPMQASPSTSRVESLSNAEMTAISGAGYNNCPSTVNECNEPDGCHVLNQHKYIDWHGLIRCRGYFGSCGNNNMGLCKTEYNVSSCVRPGPGAIGTDRDEEKCN